MVDGDIEERATEGKGEMMEHMGLVSEYFT